MSTCRTCQWSKVIQQPGKDGPLVMRCHRYPPQVVGGLAQGPQGPVSLGDAHRPVVEPGDTCGEHRQALALN